MSKPTPTVVLKRSNFRKRRNFDEHLSVITAACMQDQTPNSENRQNFVREVTWSNVAMALEAVLSLKSDAKVTNIAIFGKQDH